MTNQTWYLYIIQTAASHLYTGITTDVERRVLQHEVGKGAKYLRGKGPLKLCLVQPCINRSVASKLEYAVKALSKQQKLELIKQPNLITQLMID